MTIPNSLEFWERVAKDYEAVQDRRERPFEFRQIAKIVISGDPILEIGSAFGMFTKYLHPSVHYVGMELSPSMVAKSRALFPGRAFFCLDMMKAGAEWDGVFSTGIAGQLLEHFPDLETPMGPIKRIVRDRLIFSVPRGKIKDKAGAWLADGHILSWADEDEIAADLKSFGRVDFFKGAPNHICGVVTWNGPPPFIPETPKLPLHRAP